MSLPCWNVPLSRGFVCRLFKEASSLKLGSSLLLKMNWTTQTHCFNNSALNEMDHWFSGCVTADLINVNTLLIGSNVNYLHCDCFSTVIRLGGCMREVEKMGMTYGIDYSCLVMQRCCFCVIIRSVIARPFGNLLHL